MKEHLTPRTAVIVILICIIGILLAACSSDMTSCTVWKGPGITLELGCPDEIGQPATTGSIQLSEPIGDK